MESISKNRTRILYIGMREIRNLDIPRTLDEIGYEVYRVDTDISAQEYERNACQTVIAMIEEFKIEYVITNDFSESIAQACFETGIPYISWVYDAPQRELYTHYAFYPSNYIFVFDKKQKERLRQIGIENVYYMPLAIMPNKVNIVLNENREEQAEVAFVGRLWKEDFQESLMQNRKKLLYDQLQKNIEECFLRWGKNVSVYGKMEEDCVEYFDSIDRGIVAQKYPYISKQFYYEAAVTSRMIANKERVIILNTLAEKYDMKFYTDCKETGELNPKVKIMPPVKYDEISYIYQNSKININISLHCIETGIPQRVFDIMAAGGFLLSNYQEELEELFVPGEDIVLYHNLEELEKKVEYYLTHEEERKRIAKNGQKKVMAYHDMHERMKTMIGFVVKKETARTKPYSLLQKEGFYKQLDNLLAEGKDDSYEKIYHLLKSLKYAEDVPNAEELLWLHEMLNCRKIEKDNGVSNIFSDIRNLKEANQKYLRIKYGVWRIENDLSEEKCREAVYRIWKNKESMLLTSWIIKTNVEEPEKVYLTVSEYMKDYNIFESIRLLSYGAKYFPQSGRLMQKQMEYFEFLKEIKEKV